RFAMLGFDGQDRVDRRERLLGTAEAQKCSAARQQCVDIIGHYRERPVADLERFVIEIERIQNASQIAQRLDRAGIHIQRCLKQSRRIGAVTLLLPQDPQQVQRVEVIGSYLEDRGVKLFGFGKLSTLMKCDGVLCGFRYDGVVVCHWLGVCHFSDYPLRSTRNLRWRSPRRWISHIVTYAALLFRLKLLT